MLLEQHGATLLSLYVYVAVSVAMGVQEGAPPAYFAGTHAKFQATSDVVLQLHDGARQLLACSSLPARRPQAA